jgi:hypothetical protein
MNPTGYTAQTMSDLYGAGSTYDGQPFIAESFYVVIENLAGRRFAHRVRFRSAERHYCEETGEPYFSNLREVASGKAERLAERVNAAIAAGKALNDAYWYEIDPAYGSDEYQAQGVEFERALADREG